MEGAKRCLGTRQSSSPRCPGNCGGNQKVPKKVPKNEGFPIITLFLAVLGVDNIKFPYIMLYKKSMQLTRVRTNLHFRKPQTFDDWSLDEAFLGGRSSRRCLWLVVSIHPLVENWIESPQHQEKTCDTTNHDINFGWILVWWVLVKKNLMEIQGGKVELNQPREK